MVVVAVTAIAEGSEGVIDSGWGTVAVRLPAEVASKPLERRSEKISTECAPVTAFNNHRGATELWEDAGQGSSFEALFLPDLQTGKLPLGDCCT